MVSRSLNPFWYYRRGSANQDKPVANAKQLEDNTTAALLFTLDMMPTRATQKMLELGFESVPNISNETIEVNDQVGIDEIPNSGDVVLVGISSRCSLQLREGDIITGADELDADGGVVDGVIHCPEVPFTIIIESKTNLPYLNPDQLRRYAGSLEIDTEKVATLSWYEVGGLFENLSSRRVRWLDDHHETFAELLSDYLQYIHQGGVLARAPWGDGSDEKFKDLRLVFGQTPNIVTPEAQQDEYEFAFKFTYGGRDSPTPSPVTLTPAEFEALFEEAIDTTPELEQLLRADEESLTTGQVRQTFRNIHQNGDSPYSGATTQDHVLAKVGSKSFGANKRLRIRKKEDSYRLEIQVYDETNMNAHRGERPLYIPGEFHALLDPEQCGYGLTPEIRSALFIEHDFEKVLSYSGEN